MSQAINTVNKISTPIKNSSRPWGRAMIWLLFLGSFFFLSYGLSNELASHHSDVTQMIFYWEHSIPFIPWTIIPYWSIDLLYVLSFFICKNKFELDSHARRLLTAQIIAVSCFILFPLQFGFTRPETSGLSGWLFMTLSQFDQPYNQAPSLHITLLVILWSLYIQHIPKVLKVIFHLWFLLIGVSVLTTYQHHFFDIPTGLLLGWFCIWLWPLNNTSPLKKIRWFRNTRHWKIAASYLFISIVLFICSLNFRGITLWLIWPAVSLFLVSLNYLFLGANGFQKNSNGEQSLAAKWLFFPYTLCAYINSQLWTIKSKEVVKIGDTIYLGRFPSTKTIKKYGFDLVIDMTAELNKPICQVSWYSIPCLDLLPPAQEDLIKATNLISKYKGKKILVCCALGYSRSVLTILTWMLLSKPYLTIDEAIQQLRVMRPEIVINHHAKKTLENIVYTREVQNDYR